MPLSDADASSAVAQDWFLDTLEDGGESGPITASGCPDGVVQLTT